MEHTDRTGATALAMPSAGGEADGLRRLAEVVAGTADLTAAIRDVNRLVAAPLGLRVSSCALVSSQLRAATGSPAPDGEQAEVIERWRTAHRHGVALEPVHTTQTARSDAAGTRITLVPVVHRHRVHGAALMTGETADALHSSPLLPAIGLAFGEVAWKASVRRELARNRRRLAIAVEQERAARDVQTSVHRRLAALGDRLVAHIADAPDRVWRERMEELLHLTGEVDREVRQSLNVLRTMPAQGDDLPASLRAIAREISAETELFVKVFVDGEPRRLSAARVEALFHVAVESLLAAALSARAENAVMILDYEPGEVSLVVRDDGVGLAHRNVFATTGRESIRGLQQRLQRVGGTLGLHSLQPRGLAVEARVPAPARGGRTA